MQAPVVILHLVANDSNGSVRTHLEVFQTQSFRNNQAPIPPGSSAADPSATRLRPDVTSFPTDVPEVESSTESLAEPTSEANSPDNAHLRAQPGLREQSPALPVALSPAAAAVPKAAPASASKQTAPPPESGGDSHAGSSAEQAHGAETRQQEGGHHEAPAVQDASSAAREESPSEPGTPTTSASVRARLAVLLPMLQELDIESTPETEFWGRVTEEISALQDASVRLAGQVERLQQVEASVGQLQNVLEVVHSELEAGHKTSHELEKRALAAESALQRAEARAQNAEQELAAAAAAPKRAPKEGIVLPPQVGPKRQDHARQGPTAHALMPKETSARAHHIALRTQAELEQSLGGRSSRERRSSDITLMHSRTPREMQQRPALSLTSSPRAVRRHGASPSRSVSAHLRTYQGFTAASAAQAAAADSARGGRTSGDLQDSGDLLDSIVDGYDGVGLGRTTSSGARMTYGMDERFQAAAQALNNRQSEGQSELDKTQRWLKGILSSKSAVDNNPKVVDAMVKQLQSGLAGYGVRVPFQKTGACQYSVNGQKMVLKNINDKLMVRCGGGYEAMLTYLEKVTAME